MKPEDKAREEIDRQLEECGWLVQSKNEMNIHAGLGVAIREFQLKSGFVGGAASPTTPMGGEGASTAELTASQTNQYIADHFRGR